MNNILKTAIDIYALIESGKIISKVNGRRNYVIRLEMKDKYAFVGGFGQMSRRGLMSEFLSYISKHGTTWAEYTYKKDFLKAIEILKENEITVNGIN